MALKAPASGDELTRRITGSLAGNLEAAAVLFQAVALAGTATVANLTGSGRALLFALAVIHLVAAAAIQRTGGPFTRADGWTVLWLGATVIVPLLMAHILRPGHYAQDPSCVQLCSYPAAPVLFFAFYPWLTVGRTYLRPAVEAALLVIVVIEPLLIVEWLALGPLSAGTYLSVEVSGAWNILAYVMGKVVGRMFRAAALQQIELQRRDYQDFFNFLHSEVEGAVAVIEREGADRAAVADKLRKLYGSLSRRRIEMQLAGDDVAVAPLLAETLRIYAGALEIGESPRPGGLTLPRAPAALLYRTLGDLLKNATQHGASRVEVRFWTAERAINLEVEDDGPGFDPAVLDDPGTSLHSLRLEARGLGGELDHEPLRPHGTRMLLTMPAHT